MTQSDAAEPSDAADQRDAVNPPDAESTSLPGAPGAPPPVEPERLLLERAIGGWRGLIDSALPSAVFLVVYVIADELAPALWAALVSGVLVAVLRLTRRESLQQVFAGFIGVAFSAFIASRTGQAEDFYLPGLLVNVAYGSAFLISILVRWPLLGLLVGGFTGDLTGWRSSPQLRRVYSLASWLWVALFGLRLAVQLPLYLAGWVGPLGVARLVMGWPLFLLTAWASYLLLRPTLQAARQ